MWQIFQRVGINTSENTQPHTENLQILLVPLESAKRQLEKKKKWKNCPMHTINAGRCVPHATDLVITRLGAQSIHVPM